MKNKGAVGLIVLTAVILAIIAVYNYNKASQNFPDNNINGPGAPVIKGPAITITPIRYDLGTVIYGEVAEHTFVVKNSGDEPLEILRLSTSCGCTKAAMAKEDKVIAPGQSANLLVTFDPAVHKDDSDLGDRKEMPDLEGDVPQNLQVAVKYVYMLNFEHRNPLQGRPR